MLSTVKKLGILLIFLLIPFNVQAEKLDVYLFYGNECAYCHQEREFLDITNRKYHGNITIHEYEVWHNSKNLKFMMEVKDKLGDKGEGVPYTVIGLKTFNGFEEETGKEILKEIDNSLIKTPGNVVKSLQNDKKIEKTKENNTLVMPVVGETNIKENIIFNTVLLAVADTFTLNNLFLVFFITSLLVLASKYKKTLTLTILPIAIIIYGLLIFKVLTFNNLTSVIIKTIIAGLTIIISAFSLSRFIKKLDNKKDNKLENFIFKHQFIWSIIFGILFGIIMGLLFINVSQGYPHILKLILQINGLSNFYYILYFIILLGFDLILIKLVDCILTKFKLNKYIICFLILIICSIILVFFPKLFLFTS